MPRIPRERTLDSTRALLTEGYTFIPSRCRRFGSDAFETRLMLQRVVCMTGEEAARVFYEPDRFTRRRAVPPTTLMLLQDKGSVATLDGAAHRWRKEMFLSLMDPDALREMMDGFEAEWRARIPQWERRHGVVLHEEAQEILCAAVCHWAGIPLTATELKERTREFAAMIDGAGAVGPRNWRGLALRTRTERWAADVIRRVRAGRLVAPEGRAAHVVASHRDAGGQPLDEKVAAVELLNVLRPTVAVARYVTFAALALHRYPEWRERLAADGDAVTLFVHEVRRFYPFFPAIGGRVREPFTWRDHRFEEGDWVLLDLHGTNHDPRAWNTPDAFDPERFRDRDGSPFDFVPQGGGDHHENHRCAGEWLTIAILERAVRLLAGMTYDVPEQDLRVDLRRMPALPASGFMIRDVRTRGAA